MPISDPPPKRRVLASSIPEELLLEILKRAPLKTVGKSMCVCKSWNSLLSSSHFVALYQQHLQNNTQKPYLLSKRAFACNAYASFHLPQDGENVVNPWTGFNRLPFRCFPSVRSGTLISACNRNNPEFVDVINGIVCLVTSSEPSISVILWNPLIRKYLVIPNSVEIEVDVYPIQENPPSVGFGYDGSADDFRVIRLWMPIHSGKPLVFDVLSLKAGVWRRRAVDVSNFIPPSKVISQFSLFLNGIIHWIIVSDVDECYLLMFDCQREEFKKVKLPPQFNRFSRPKLFNYGGVVAFTTSSYSDKWVMVECKSWRRLPFVPDYIRNSVTSSVSMGSLMLINHAAAQLVVSEKVAKVYHEFFLI